MGSLQAAPLLLPSSLRAALRPETTRHLVFVYEPRKLPRDLDGSADPQRASFLCPVRIRDKFAASRRKGMWMGGNVPLGYDVAGRRLVVNEAEAKTVKSIFERYL